MHQLDLNLDNLNRDYSLSNTKTAEKFGEKCIEVIALLKLLTIFGDSNVL